jgi:hypothetical protein
MAKGYSGGGRSFSSGVGRSSSSSYRSSSSSYRVAPAPTPIPKISTNSSNSSNTSTNTTNSGGFLSSVADGFSFGVGSSIARNMVDSIFHPIPRVYSSSSSTSSNTETKEKKDEVKGKTCEDLVKTFRECMTMNSTNFDVCNQAYQDYNQCMLQKENK